MPDISQTPDRRLWQALHDGNFDAADQAIADGADVNSQSASGIAAFLHFAGDGHMAPARFLAERGADINAKDRMGQNALHRVAIAGHIKAVSELVQMGVDWRAVTASGATPMLLAVVQRRPDDMVNAMLQSGVDPNVRSPGGATPLLAAIAAEHYQLALEMIARGADPTVVDHLGQGILHSLPPKPPIDFVKMLLMVAPQIDLDLRARSGTTPLGQAAEYADADRIALYLERGANPNTRSSNNFSSAPTPLMILAAKEGEPDLPALKVALAKGADVTLRDNHGKNAAWYATQGHRDLDLLQDVSPEEQAEAWEKDNREMTRKVLEILVSKGLDPTQPLSRDGLSPMLLAPKGEEGAAWIQDMLDLGFPAEPGREPGDLPTGEQVFP